VTAAEADRGTPHLDVNALFVFAPMRALPLAPLNTSLLYALLFNAFMFGIGAISGS
jgi:hypothetical protein